jgi:acetyl-CoA carboxylase carboxyl transferase subunit alpha
LSEAGTVRVRLDGDGGVLAVSDLLLSMVESLWDGSRNGSSRSKMESANKAQHELEKIEQQIRQLERLAGHNQEAHRKLDQLHGRVRALRQQIHSQLNAWEKTELARHPQRPNLLEYIERIFTDWSEIHGDRSYSDDPALVCGMARFHGDEVLVIGHQKARETREKVYRNFGMANPEGYRKSLRTMRLAEKFGRPVFTFVDTPGAYPGVGAEERGQAEAIAHNLREMTRLRVPILTTITGEGGSGGALAIAVADRVLMMENAIYSVITPEGCASIVWRDSGRKEVAAEALRITAGDLDELGCIDDVVPEPEGGAHRDHQASATLLDEALQKHYGELKKMPVEELVASRYEKFRNMAQFFTPAP